jgi:hypothetical protein
VPLQGRARVAALDERLHDGEVLARADQVRRGTRPQQQAQRIDENGLAGAGFPRQESQTWSQLQRDVVDERDILYFQ